MSTRWGPRLDTDGPRNDAECTDDFELIDEVEWGPRRDEDGYDTDQELAPKPRRKAISDACGCLPPKEGMACIDESCVLYACREECRSNCEAGHICGNKRLQKKQFKDVEVFDAGVKGKGLRLSETTTPAIKGDNLCEYTGRAIREAALNRLFRRYQFDRRLFILALGDGIFIDARKKGGIARFINHSCEPNCKVERWNVKGIMRAAVVALRTIQPGEELCFDYQWERKKGRAPTICHCRAPSCRGTLEMTKTLEESNLERSLEGHWERVTSADQTVVNRTVKVFSKEYKEYFLGEVTGYDAEKNLHCVLYRQEMNEVWEDLDQEDWMVLNEKVDNPMIAKKVPKPKSDLRRSLIEVKPPGTFVKNYVYTQTPIKEGLINLHLIERLQRTCVVQVSFEQTSLPPVSSRVLGRPCLYDCDADEEEKFAALNQSKDATVWKLTIQGADIPRAYDTLQKNIAFVEKKVADESNAGKTEPKTEAIVDEAIFPRLVADVVKRKIQSVREKCRCVNFNFVSSESKSKQFCRLLLEGSLLSDVVKAKEHLWNFLLLICTEENAPMTPNKIFRNLGFFGGELSAEDFGLLVDSNRSANRRLQLSAQEDLNRSPFIKSFERSYRCTVWIQAQDDQGRINSRNQVVGEPMPDSPRKLYFGSKPSEVTGLAAALKSRATELARGVKYLYLGSDRVYAKLMMQNGRFFDFVKQVTGATVMVDPMVCDHLRIDGRLAASSEVVVNDMSESERAALADEIVRLQVEFYRDQCIREQPWIFGRDWTLSTVAVEDDLENNNGAVGTVDRGSASQCGIEIADIVAHLDLDGQIAGHAALILYRFANALPKLSTQVKLREAILACVYLANKAQKNVRWKRLGDILQAGYSIYYPGTKLDTLSEEATFLEEKVVAAESEILETVEYDVFCRDIEWIRVAASGGGKMPNELVEATFKVAFSGPVLCCGAELWLKYGIDYVFAAAAAFLKADLSRLLPALSLIPLKVSQAAELIASFSNFDQRLSSKKTTSHPLLQEGKKAMEEYLPSIKTECVDMMNNVSAHNGVNADASATELRYRIIGQRARECFAIRAVPSNIVKQSVLPILQRVAADSSCRILVGGNFERVDTEDIFLDGSWRSISIADHLLRENLGTTEIAAAVNVSAEKRNWPGEQAKMSPGLLSVNDLSTTDGWKGTIQVNPTTIDSSCRLGGKCCVPGKFSEDALRRAGLRWWVPLEYGPSPSGAIPDMCVVRSDEFPVDRLAELARSIAVDSKAFPILSSRMESQQSDRPMERFVPVSVHRWPPVKVASKESAQSKKSSTKSSAHAGFSAAALQEMQILQQLHGVIPAPQGHPNFILPIGIASLPPEQDKRPSDAFAVKGEDLMAIDMQSSHDKIFSLFSANEEDNSAPELKKVEDGAHIVFEPTPFVLQRFLSRKNRGSEESLITANIVAAWFHDILSALVHCHTNSILLRSILPDQIAVDSSGVAKLAAMYRCTVLTPQDRIEPLDPIEAAINASTKGKKKKDDDELSGNTYTAPELLLGCPKHSKPSDVWAVGCLLANLLLSKPLFVGKDRPSLLTSVYKVVGYEEARKYPKFEEPVRKYRRKVERAFEHALKDQAPQHGRAIALIARILHLDPSKRCTAEQALADDYMTEYVENTRSEDFRKQFVVDWLALKRHMMENGQKRDEEKSRKRRMAMFMAASKPPANDDDNVGDDLYDLDDILAQADKKAKPGELKTSLPS